MERVLVPSGAPPPVRRALTRAEGQFDAFSAKGFARGTMAEMCITWPSEGTAKPYRSTGVFPDVPVLVLAADLDANTSVASGGAAARQFKRSTLVTVPNMGHVADYNPSGCVASLVTAFIRTGAVGDTTCLKAIPPIKVHPVRGSHD
ncbi:alpha/beta hydrolase [Rhizohabitans arisaemae]|uniref:alpha/beta hydrolase n=1 Tax=Rhizohabitans arisaemae TaxID=2720610 RepID=UPI0024B2661B|nr:alpha/beta hydrolase [Rhizohabitans arisaemae]